MPVSTSNFEFLHDEFPALYAIGKEAEFLLHHDPAAALSKLRVFGEKLVDQVFAEHQLAPLNDNTQHHRLGELKRQGLLPRQVEDILYLLKRKGNAAAHDNVGSLADASLLLESAFHLGKWLLNTYATGAEQAPATFALPVPRDTHQELAQLEAEKHALEQRVAELQANLAARPAFTAPQVAQLQHKSQQAADNLNLSEAETRAIIADQLEARFDQAAAMVEQLPQALLAKAFSGQLVPQDPDDEPTSALLERLRAPQASLAVPTTGKRGRKPMKAGSLFE